ncbi:sensor histidine kinase [Aureibaculum conchae]|uniref:sensor histidine kinase n=1 Tax=Aureibaculum sp. 2308TA14-22 TaxID=3108392 RepID=UPI0033999334
MKILVIKNFVLKYGELFIHLLFWSFYFAFINVEWTNEWLNKTIRPNTPSPILALLFPFLFYLNAFWMIPKYLKNRKAGLYVVIVVVGSLILELLRVLIVLLIKFKTVLTIDAVIEEFLSRDSILFGAPSVLLFSLLFSFAYRFTKDWIINNRVIEQLKTEKIQMELNVLKSHINPHFLFNNLNALDDLIDRDKNKAKEYLHKLSKMYRYLIMNMENDIVNLQEEWSFMEDYIYLIEERYGKAYQFEKLNNLYNLYHYLIPPASLQSLIENVVKHNQGTIENPLKVVIQIDKNGLSISHIKQLKTNVANSLGTGLRNLKSRYKLLTYRDISIQDGTKFTVTLPLIKELQ